MPTVFQICVEGNTGSTGRIAESIGQLAIERGWKSYIANGRFTRPSKSTLIHIGSNWGVYWHGLLTRLFDRHGLGSKRATRRLVKQIAEIRPDIIHLHHLHGYYINIEVLFDYLSSASIPVIWTFHDCWSITGHCAYFDFVGCHKWKVECNNCPLRSEYPASLFIDRSKKNYHLKRALFTSVRKMIIVPVSDWLNDILDESFMKSVLRRVIHNGIDINVFAPRANHQGERAKLAIRGRFMILGAANSWVKRKGLRDFMELSKFINSNYVIVLVGLNDDEIRGLPKNIIGLKKIENQQQLAALFGTADVFLNPTLEDNFPTTNLEALACGTPVITYRTGGSIEAITPETGFVVEKGDIEGLLNAVDIVNKYGKSHYTFACRERAVRYFNKDDRFTEYINLYNEAINSP